MDNETEKPNKSEFTVNIADYRKLVEDFMDLQDYNTALFWADKACALTNGDARDVYIMARCMYSLNEYHRASEVIKQYQLHKTNIMCHYLAVKCLVQAKMFQEALDLLNAVDNETSLNVTTSYPDDEFVSEDKTRGRICSLLNFLRGQVFEALDNRVLACECYRSALQNDVYCYEAFNALVQHQMLTAFEEKQLLDSLPFNSQCNESEAKIIRSLYEGTLKKFHSNKITSPTMISLNIDELQGDFEMHNTISETNKLISGSNKKDSGKKSNQWSTSVQVSLAQNQSIISNPNRMSSMSWSFANKPLKTKSNENNSTNMEKNNLFLISLDEAAKRLENSLDVLVSKAETHFYNCRYRLCLHMTESILDRDPFHVGCLKVHISCLSEMCNFNRLFYLAHKLVDLYPDKAISWYAVGCYYYIIGKSDPARRYLTKATTLDKLLGPAWLAYGHSFGVENEHDQAMAAYFKASQLMRGCHLPMLYIGLECGLTNNNKLAEKFFQQAEKIAPEDPFVIHEMGVIAFHNQDYERAEIRFREALKKVSSGDCIFNECWETLINNLGHACRKNGKLQEALEFHRQALKIEPQNPSTYSAIGFIQALMRDTARAVESFHIALGLRRDDTFSTTMLSHTIEQLMDDDLSSDDFPADDSFAVKGVRLREGAPSQVKVIAGGAGGAPETSTRSGEGEADGEEVLPLSSSNNSMSASRNDATCLEDMSMSMEE